MGGGASKSDPAGFPSSREEALSQGYTQDEIEEYVRGEKSIGQSYSCPLANADIPFDWKQPTSCPFHAHRIVQDYKMSNVVVPLKLHNGFTHMPTKEQGS